MEGRVGGHVWFSYWKYRCVDGRILESVGGCVDAQTGG